MVHYSATPFRFDPSGGNLLMDILIRKQNQLLAVNEALEKFAALDPSKAELVTLRYFVGMSYDEAAAALGIAVPTAKQWWAHARAWLSVELWDEAN